MLSKWSFNSSVEINSHGTNVRGCLLEPKSARGRARGRISAAISVPGLPGPHACKHRICSGVFTFSLTSPWPCKSDLLLSHSSYYWVFLRENKTLWSCLNVVCSKETIVYIWSAISYSAQLWGIFPTFLSAFSSFISLFLSFFLPSFFSFFLPSFLSLLPSFIQIPISQRYGVGGVFQ